MSVQEQKIIPHVPWWRWAMLLFLGSLVMFVPLPARAHPATERKFTIDARRFEYTPAILRVNPGDRVSIELVATDVVHGFALDGYNLELTAEPGMAAHLSFVADQAGTFRFRCSMTCGNLHPFMTGKLEVGQNMLLWRAVALSGLALIAALWKR